MRRLGGAVLAVLMALGATPAFATGEIACEGDGVSVDMLVGRLEVLAILRVVVRIGDKTWSSDQSYAEGTPIQVGQRFEDDRMLLVDFTDDNVEGVIARLRAFSLTEGDNYVSGGAFSMKGEGAYLVDCSLRG